MLKLIWLAFKNQCSAQLKKPIEFMSATIALILNNSFYLYGIYLLAILSVGAKSEATQEYLISTGIVLTSWGILNIFGGGLYQLGSLVETGEIETFLARPRHPLFLIAISKSNLISIGEFFQGVFTIALAALLYGLPFALRALASSLLLTLAFAGVVIIIGTLSFFSTRGSQLSYVILNIILTLSLFPIGRALQGKERWILYFTPILMTATLPRLATITGNPIYCAVSVIATFALFFFSLFLFHFGLKRYKSKNYIFLNE